MDQIQKYRISDIAVCVWAVKQQDKEEYRMEIEKLGDTGSYDKED
ncbi:unnamed protein product (macronuclear) [Paramecium tetraurelia]|uniref:Protein kinase domain-containing protein n=1 Tax=Paramecium tetraurelia TaxID=5888 RepID=A0C433_PARTE|nr:uncharacterized protein GSPATT00035030001 [Paramecium tetraurelia]CAK65550.1 unnamed protein product [Paramecium tetraurelia]|eukprot:XP_001432947.1 hypothetical protein (macronuclear) [Paramecium tetraurelia strain d4-2]